MKEIPWYCTYLRWNRPFRWYMQQLYCLKIGTIPCNFSIIKGRLTSSISDVILDFWPCWTTLDLWTLAWIMKLYLILWTWWKLTLVYLTINSWSKSSCKLPAMASTLLSDKAWVISINQTLIIDGLHLYGENDVKT